MRPNNSYSVWRKNKVQLPKKGSIFSKMLIWNRSKLTHVTTPIFGTNFGRCTFDKTVVHMLRIKLIITSLIISVHGLYASSNDTTIVDPRLEAVYQQFLQDAQSEEFDGYTIQLFSGERNNAYGLRARVISLDLGEARVIYKEPNFKVHVGSFPTIIMAEKERQKIIEFFPDAFVVKTSVPFYPIEIPEKPSVDSLQVPLDLVLPQDSILPAPDNRVLPRDSL